MQVFGLPRQVTRIASLASRQDRPNRDIIGHGMVQIASLPSESQGIRCLV